MRVVRSWWSNHRKNNRAVSFARGECSPPRRMAGFVHKSLELLQLSEDSRDDLEGCLVLLEQGASPNWRKPGDGSTPLIAAARSGCLGVVAALLDATGQPANVNLANRAGVTAIHAACELGRAKCVRALLKGGHTAAPSPNPTPNAAYSHARLPTRSQPARMPASPRTMVPHRSSPRSAAATPTLSACFWRREPTCEPPAPLGSRHCRWRSRADAPTWRACCMSGFRRKTRPSRHATAEAAAQPHTSPRPHARSRLSPEHAAMRRIAPPLRLRRPPGLVLAGRRCCS